MSIEVDGNLSWAARVNTDNLAGDIDKVIKELNRLKKDTDEISGKASTKLSNVSNTAKSTGSNIGSYLAGGFAAGLGIHTARLLEQAISKTVELGKQAFWSAANFEQMGVAFSTMLQSRDKAGRLLQDIQDFALVTPYGTIALVDFTKQLLAFGFQAEEIVPTLDKLGNVAAGIGTDKMHSLVYAFGQVKTAGRLMGQELMQMVNAGFNPLYEISQKTGESVVSLRDKMGKGLISFDMVKEAFALATEEGGRFHQLMQTQTATTAGKMEVLKDLMEKLRIAVGSNMTGTVGLFVTSFSNLVQEVTDYFSLDAVEKFEQERSEITALADAISNSNGDRDAQNKLISEMQKKYPDFLGNLNQEHITNAFIRDRLTEVNRQYEYKIKLMQQSMILEAQQSELQDMNAKRAKYYNLQARLSQIDKNNKYGLNDLSIEDFAKGLGRLGNKQASIWDGVKAFFGTDALSGTVGKELKKEIAKFQKSISFGELAKGALFGDFHSVEAAGDNAVKFFEDYSKKMTDINKTISKVSGETNKAQVDYLQEQQEAMRSSMSKIKEYRDRLNSLKNSDGDKKGLQTALAQERVVLEGLIKSTNEALGKTEDLNKAIAGTGTEAGKGKGKKGKTESTYNDLQATVKLLEKVSSSPEKYKLSSLTDFEREGAELEKYFADLEKEVKEFNNNPNNKVKINEAEALSLLEQRKAEANVLLGQKNEATQLKETLTTQKQLYSEFEDWKVQFGEDRARKEFGLSSTYLQLLKDEEQKAIAENNDFKKKLLSDLLKTEIEESRKKDLQVLEDAMKTAETQAQAIARVQEEYERKKAALGRGKLEADGTYTTQSISKGQREQLDKWLSDQIEAINRSYSNLDIDAIISATTATTKRELQIQIEYLQEYLKTTDKLTSAQKEGIQKNIDELRDKLLTAPTDGSEFLGIDFKKTQREIDATRLDLERLKKAKDAINSQTAKSEQDIIRLAQLDAEISMTEAKLKDLNFSKPFDDIKNGVALASKNIETLRDSLGGIDDDLDAILSTMDTFVSGIGTMIDGMKALMHAGKVAVEGVSESMNAAEKASVILAIVGAAVKAINAIKNLIGGYKRARIEAEKELKTFNDNVLKGELSYSAALRERNLLEAKNISLTKERIKLTTELLGKQAGEINNQYNDVLKQLQGEQYVSGKEKYKKWALGRVRTRDVLSDLAGKTYGDIEKLYNSNQLTDKAKLLFEELKKLKEEGADVAGVLGDVAKEASEIFTGTTADSITDSIIEGYRNGKRAVEDFAEDAEDIIRNAMLNALKYDVLQAPVQALYEQFAKDAKDGLTQEEAAAFKTGYSEIIKTGNSYIQSLKDAGIEFDKLDKNNTLSGAISGIRQDQANIIAGQLSGIQISVSDIRNDSRQMMALATKNLESVIGIETNTKETVKELKQLNAKIKGDNSRAVGF